MYSYIDFYTEGLMEDGFRKLMQKVEAFEKTHTKNTLTARKNKIKELFAEMELQLADEADFSLTEKTDSIEIMAIADSFLTCDEAHALNELISEANYSEANIRNGKIVFRLWFRLWKWV